MRYQFCITENIPFRMFAAFPIKDSDLPIFQASLSSVLFLKHSPSMERWHILHIYNHFICHIKVYHHDRKSRYDGFRYISAHNIAMLMSLKLTKLHLFYCVSATADVTHISNYTGLPLLFAQQCSTDVRMKCHWGVPGNASAQWSHQHFGYSESFSLSNYCNLYK